MKDSALESTSVGGMIVEGSSMAISRGKGHGIGSEEARSKILPCCILCIGKAISMARQRTLVPTSNASLTV